VPIIPFMDERPIDELDAAPMGSAATQNVAHRTTGEEAAEFDEALAGVNFSTRQDLDSGDIVDAIVVSIGENDVLLDVGDKAECAVPVEEFKDLAAGPLPIQVGDSVKVIINGRSNSGQLMVSHRKALRQMGLAHVQEAFRTHTLLQGIVEKEVKGGLIVDIDGVQAFLPASQVDLKHVDNLADWAGKPINCYVIDYIKDRKRVVVSHRAVLEEEQNLVRDAVISQLVVGEVIGATVKTITDFGVFVDLGGGVDGLIPREEISWEKGGHPSQYVVVGDSVMVKVLSITRTEKKTKISLSRKQAKADPFEILPVKYPVGSEIDGEIVGITHFGAFVRIEEGIQGMIHVSDISWSGGNKRVKDYVKVGDRVKCQVLELDAERRRLSLGLKQLQDDPWELIEHRFPPGSRIKGTVTSLVQYGAFVKIADELEGLVHITDFSWDKKVTKPSQLLKKGDEVECKVLSIDKENRRLSLGIKQLSSSPFEEFVATTRVGDTLEGTVTKLESFGAFVEVAPLVEGLLHVSQISETRIEDPKSVLQVGEKIQVKITKVDRKNEKISLSRREVLRDIERQEIETYMVSSSEAIAAGDTAKPTIGSSKTSVGNSLAEALAGMNLKIGKSDNQDN